MHDERRRLAAVLVIAATLVVPAFQTAADDWPQWRGPNRDGMWHETGVLETLPEGQLPIRWRMPIGSGYSGPTVAGDSVFVTDRIIGPESIGGSSERIWCFDRTTGEVRWSHAYHAAYHEVSYDAGPRCSVIVHDGRAYSLGAAGHLFCFDADRGEIIFEHDLREIYDIDMPVWGISATPVIEDDLLIVPVSGRDNASIVAFDRISGEERWRALPDRGNYSAPIVVDHAGHRVFICWTGDRIVGLDPATGTLHWEHPFPSKNMPLGVASPVYHDGLVFFSGFYDGCLLLRLLPDELSVEEVWRRSGPNELRTDGLQGIISTAFIRDGHIYGVDSYGELRCLKLEDGERIWEDLTAVPKARWATIHFVQNGDRTWMFNERGELLIAELSPTGFRENSRAQLIEPTLDQLNRRGGVCWSHPAFAHGHVFARNDNEIVCTDLRRPVAGEDAEQK